MRALRPTEISDLFSTGVLQPGDVALFADMTDDQKPVVRQFSMMKKQVMDEAERARLAGACEYADMGLLMDSVSVAVAGRGIQYWTGFGNIMTVRVFRLPGITLRESVYAVGHYRSMHARGSLRALFHSLIDCFRWGMYSMPISGLFEVHEGFRKWYGQYGGCPASLAANTGYIRPVTEFIFRPEVLCSHDSSDDPTQKPFQA